MTPADHSQYRRHLFSTCARSATWLTFLIILASSALLSGCRASECDQMVRCCAHVKGLDGLGSACGSLADGATSPDTCRVTVEVVRHMLDEQGRPIPSSCQ